MVDNRVAAGSDGWVSMMDNPLMIEQAIVFHNN